MSNMQVQLVGVENGVLCEPGEGYAKTAEVDIGTLVKVGSMGGRPLPKSNATFPLGGPVSGLYVYNGDVYELKR